MKLQNQCCTSEQAFKLKELGITQERLCANYTWEIKEGPSNWFHYQAPFIYAEDAHRFTTAFTVAEMSAMLPAPYSIGKNFGSIGMSLGTKGEYFTVYIEDYSYHDKTMAIALAHTLIDMLQRIPAKEFNDRLKAS